MQNIVAVILLTIAALEGALTAPLADANAVDFSTNEKFPESAAFEVAEEVYGESIWTRQMNMPTPSGRLANFGSQLGMLPKMMRSRTVRHFLMHLNAPPPLPH